MEPSQSAPHLRSTYHATAEAQGDGAREGSPQQEGHPALLQHPQFQALYRQLLMSLNQHGWKDPAATEAQKRTDQPAPRVNNAPRPRLDPQSSLQQRLQENLQQHILRQAQALIPPPPQQGLLRPMGGPQEMPMEMSPPPVDASMGLPHYAAPKERAWLPPSRPVSHGLPPGLSPDPAQNRPPLPLGLLQALTPVAQRQVANPPPGLLLNQMQQHIPVPQQIPTQIPQIPQMPQQMPPQISQQRPQQQPYRMPPAPVSDTQRQVASEEDEDELDEHQAESKHFREVCQAFATYENMAMVEVERMERHFRALSAAEQELLIESVDDRMQKIRDGVIANQRFLNLLISQELDIVDDDLAVKGGCSSGGLEGLLADFRAHANRDEDSASSDYQCSDPIEPGCAIEDCEVSSMNMYKVRSTLKQFAREWSAERAVEREAAFRPLLNALDRYLPLADFKIKHDRVPCVLCPGSGLGRLPFEVVCKGYACQGNEFSYFMLLGSNFILNYALEPASISLVPFCLNSCNRREHDDHLQVIKIPDVCAGEGVAAGVDFSMCAGDFVEVYMHQKAAWDAVLTCFFIDTAKNVIRYIHTIANIIPEGGLWANMGPLLYHFADSATEMSVELSWEEIRQIVVRYFDIEEEQWIDAFYTTPPRSMLQALYHCIFFVGIRNAVPVPSEFLKGGQPGPAPRQRYRHQEVL